VEVYFAYDYASRRIGKTVVDKRVAPTVTKHISYAYDQWNPVAIWERATLVAPLVLKHTNLWGLDIGSSGTVDAGAPASFQQAGGVGGLISSTHLTSNSITSDSYIPSFDANGNIIAWTAGDGTLLRKIDYDAFGNEVMVENYAAPATIAKLPEFGFSTKIKDAETGLSYYGYRYYDPKTGRWPSRDPIGEEGGANLYGFVGNDGANNFDFLGQFTLDDATASLRGRKVKPQGPLLSGFWGVVQDYSLEQKFLEWRKLEGVNIGFWKDLEKCPFCIDLSSGKPEKPEGTADFTQSKWNNPEIPKRFEEQ
jgi:RHS repeat-associated protein